MRHYVILYRRADAVWSRLIPHVQHNLYDRDEVNAAIAFMTENPCVEGVAIRIGDESFNVMAVSNPDQSGVFSMEAK